jgi:hypothetical protein
MHEPLSHDGPTTILILLGEDWAADLTPAERAFLSMLRSLPLTPLWKSRASVIARLALDRAAEGEARRA